MAPITDTKRLHTLKPVTPVEPAAAKIHPPMTPPTIPRTISRKSPSPVLLIIMLAIHPAKPPRTIQLITPITCSSRVHIFHVGHAAICVLPERALRVGKLVEKGGEATHTAAH